MVGFPPKSSILIGISHYKSSILGETPQFLETPIYSQGSLPPPWVPISKERLSFPQRLRVWKRR